MNKLAHRLLRKIRKQELMRAGDCVAVAVSGGADSLALLLLLLELRSEIGVVLLVVHVNHKLRNEESDGDEAFVRQLANDHKLEFLTHTAKVIRGAGSGIESEARRFRYEFFRSLLEDGKATKIATAHTLDDQAETVLLRMFRGSGIRGLGGIRPRLWLKKNDKEYGEVVRPLLSFRRVEIRKFLQECGQPWREDSSNRNETFLRNRVRARLLPLIVEEFGDAPLEHLADLAEIARAEEEMWEASPRYSEPSSRLTEERVAVDWLLAQPVAVRRRVVKAWIEKNVPDARISFRLIESILELALERTRHEIDLPTVANEAARELSTKPPCHPIDNDREDNPPKGNRWKILIRPKELIIELGPQDSSDYQYALTVPGEVFVPELQITISAEITNVEPVPEAERPGLVNAMRVGTELTIRNWRAGDRYWPAHTKQERKVKELLNERHITGQEKKLWPIAKCKDEIVWLRGFAAPEALRAGTGSAIWIRAISNCR
jgi:tRNA(Ile)-lysidine synthase